MIECKYKYWDIIVKEYEKDIGSRYQYQIQSGDIHEYSFVGLIHGNDDYYYGMRDVKTGHLLMLSCVGTLEGVNGHGFKKIE
jgi:hypothetical protein